MEYDDPASEPARVRAAQAGDAAALEQLIESYLPLVYAIATRALDRHADADDVVQETMVRAVAHLGDLRDPYRFRPWIVAIAVRQIRERSRRVRRRGSEVSLDALPDDPTPHLDVADLVARTVDDAAQRRTVEEAVVWLEPEDRQVLALWQLELAGSIDRDDVASGLGISRAHTAVRVHRLKARLDDARSIVTALAQAPRCPELEQAARGWDGATTPIWRKRLLRHVRSCDRCGPASAGAVPLDRLLIGAALAPVPAALVIESARIAVSTPAVTTATSIGAVQQVVASLTAKPAAVVAAAGMAGLAGGGLIVGAAVWPSGDWGPGVPEAAPPVTVTTTAPTSTRATSTPTPSRTTASPSPSKGPAAITGPLVYVSPDGDDHAPGTEKHPLRTVARAIKAVRAGQTIVLRAGVYRPRVTLTTGRDGTAAKPITLTSAEGEHAVLDGSRLGEGRNLLELTVAHWVVRDLEVRGAPGHGLACRSCSNSTFQHLDVHDNGASGMVLTGSGTTDNRVLDSDFHDNHDDATQGETADGLEIRDGSGEGNLIQGVRSFHNADDGISFWNFASGVRVMSTWSFGNGYNRWDVPGDWLGNGEGFKLGGRSDGSVDAPHEIVNSAAWDNRHRGFRGNGNDGAVRVVRSTAFANHGSGFEIPGVGAQVIRCVSVGDGEGVMFTPGVFTDLNSWQGARPNTMTFVSVDASVAEGPRGPGWSLPVSDFLIPTDPYAGASMRNTPYPD